MSEFYKVNINGYEEDLPVMPLPSGIKIAFFNLHGNQRLTEHCGKELAKLLKGSEVIITAESKGLQLAHVVAREMDMPFYAVARKSKKLYMQDGIEVSYGSSITTGKPQELYLSKHDVELIKGKKVAIVDDVVSTGASLDGLVKIVEKAGGIVYKKAFVLAEGESKNLKDIIYLATIPIIK
ncbi:MAG: phosphoribosyltransferase family protein [Clostridia bacterium]|nr:phosphoribosyltransferase family protein [Clostridia bacterium]